MNPHDHALTSRWARVTRPALYAAAFFALVVPAHRAVAVSAIQLVEYPVDSNHVGYEIRNPVTDDAFDIVLLAVSVPGSDGAPDRPPNPIAPAGWVTQELNAAMWDLPLGGSPDSGLPTWAQMTGMTYADVFIPTDPCLGFFVDIGEIDTMGQWAYIPTDPCRVGEVLGGFSRAGTIASTFVVAGPTSVDGFLGDTNVNPIAGIHTFVGEATVVPEPATVVLALISGASLFVHQVIKSDRSQLCEE